MNGLLRKMTVLTAKEFSRDILGMFFSFAFPLFFLVLFSVSSKPRAIPPINVGVIAETQNPAVAGLVSTMTRQPTLSVRSVSPTDAERLLRSGTVQGLIYVTAQRDGPPKVRTVQSRPANIYLASAIESAIAKAAAPPHAASAPAVTEDFMEQESANAFAYIIPALIGMALLQLGLFGTATPVISARARGTLMHLTMTPMPKYIVVLANVILRLAIAAIQVAVMLAVSVWFFGLRIEGNLLGALLAQGLGALMLISLGFFIAGVVPTQTSGGYIVMIANFAILFFGEIFFATKGLGVISTISLAMPTTYLADASRQLISGVDGRFPLWLDFAAMTAFSAAFLILSARTFQFSMKKA